MSLRLITCTGAATLATALALPLAAGARPDYQFDAGAGSAPSAAPAAAAPTEPVTVRPAHPAVVVRQADTGAETWVVIAIAGGTLLAGAAAGAAGSRVVARHQTVRP
jgi:hypothetical protein